MITCNHFKVNVLDLNKSLAFYKEALGLEPVREKDAYDGSFKLVYLGDGVSEFTLELTYEGIHKKHEEMGCICYENLAMGIYFITDPDGYWIEIVPEHK